VVAGGQRCCNCDYHSARWISVSLSPIYWDAARRSHIGDSYTHRTHKLKYATLQDEKNIKMFCHVLCEYRAILKNEYKMCWIKLSHSIVALCKLYYRYSSTFVFWLRIQDREDVYCGESRAHLQCVTADYCLCQFVKSSKWEETTDTPDTSINVEPHRHSFSCHSLCPFSHNFHCHQDSVLSFVIDRYWQPLTKGEFILQQWSLWFKI